MEKKSFFFQLECFQLPKKLLHFVMNKIKKRIMTIGCKFKMLLKVKKSQKNAQKTQNF